MVNSFRPVLWHSIKRLQLLGCLKNEPWRRKNSFDHRNKSDFASWFSVNCWRTSFLGRVCGWAIFEPINWTTENAWRFITIHLIDWFIEIPIWLISTTPLGQETKNHQRAFYKKNPQTSVGIDANFKPDNHPKTSPPKRLNSMFLQHVLCPEALKSKSFTTMAPMGDWLSKDFEEPSSTCGCSSLTAQTPKQVTLPKKKEKDHLPRLIFQKSIKLSDYNVTWVMFTKVSHPTTKSAWSHQSRTFQGCYPIVAPATSFFIHGIMKQYVAGQWNSLTHTHTSVLQKMVANIAHYIQDTGGSKLQTN